MALTNNLKVQVDLPVWEWLRFNPVSTVATSASCTTPNQRYIYYINAAAFYRYDTWSDNWQQLASPLTAPVTGVALVHKLTTGYTSRVISATSTTVTGAFLSGNALAGKTIRIKQGTGAGQTRTISSVADPVTAAQFLATTVVNNTSGVSSVSDSTAAWTINQYVGYQLRVAFGTGASQVRPILYNNATTATTQDANYSTVHGLLGNSPWATALSTTAGSQSAGYIESCVATVGTSWTVTPDKTSIFEIIDSGSVWMLTANAGAPFYTFQRYDIASDTWSYQTATGSLLLAALNTDWSINTTGKSLTQLYVSSTATSGSSTTLVDSVQTWTVNRWANYRVYITGGTGVGSFARIVSNTSTTLTITNTSLIPFSADNTSTYQIVADDDKIYFNGNANASMYQYSVDADGWTQGKILGYGTACIGSAQRGNSAPVALASITFSSTTATATTVINHFFQTGDSITIAGDTSVNASKYNITATITVTGATTFTYTMGSTPSTNAAFTAQGTSLLVDTSQNWATNAFANAILIVYTVGPSATAQIVRITSNTSNQLTLTTAITAAVNGTSRYIIQNYDAFGTIIPGLTSTSTSGIASTAGTTSTLTDSTKSWPVNYYAGRHIRFTGGAGIGQEAIITSNTATVLTFGVVTTAPATSTTYSIIAPPSRGAGTHLQFPFNQTDTTKAGMYLFSWRGAATNEIDRYNITTDQWELISYYPQLQTFSTGTMYCYDGNDRLYIFDATQHLLYLDLSTNRLELGGEAPYTASTLAIGNRMDLITTTDGLKYFYVMREGGTEYWRCLVWW